jgi:hypothetical protein
MAVLEIDYVKQTFGDLEGKRVTEVRGLNTKELEELMWDTRGVTPFVIFFSDGSYIIPMCDAEGNGAGSLCYCDSTGFVRS